MVSTRSSSGITPRPPKTYDAGDLVIPLPSRSRRSATPSSVSDHPADPTKPSLFGPTASSSSSDPVPAGGGWSHRPSRVTLLWLAVSLPLVAWDTAYVLGRPHTMPGGRFHRPLWVPYELYGRVDHVYGFKAWDAGLGFTAAQGTLNLVETALYAVYWGLWWRNKRADDRRVAGKEGGLAVVVGFAASVMTFSKTVLYWLNEYYSGFDNIGHNSLASLVWLWIIPNGLWLVFPCYMINALGTEMVDALAGVSRPSLKTE